MEWAIICGFKTFVALVKTEKKLCDFKSTLKLFKRQKLLSSTQALFYYFYIAFTFVFYIWLR